MCLETIVMVFLMAAQEPAAPEKAPAVQTKESAERKLKAPARKKKPAARPQRSVQRAEAARARWRQLTRERRARLRRAYKYLKSSFTEKEWNRFRQLNRGSKGPPIERLPSHWRSFLVRHARWARRQLEKLPKEQREKIASLPPEKRSEAIKEALRPLFRKHLYQCHAAAREVFTPLELKLLRQLPPKERTKVLRESGQSAFGLISPWSWRKYQDSGPRKALVWEYLNMPEALTRTKVHKPRKPRRSAVRPQRFPSHSKRDEVPRRGKDGKESKRPPAKKSPR